MEKNESHRFSSALIRVSNAFGPKEFAQKDDEIIAHRYRMRVPLIPGVDLSSLGIDKRNLPGKPVGRIDVTYQFVVGGVALNQLLSRLAVGRNSVLPTWHQLGRGGALQKNETDEGH